MKKAIKITTGICLVLSVFLLSSCFLSVDASSVGDSQEAMSWYIKRNTAHEQPVLDSKQSDIEKYDAYYLDRSCGGEQGEKILYLTFDAGYENGNIARILDTLREEKVPAAFFVLKHLIKDEPELIRRMAEEGHLVCNHTMNHKDMTCCDRETFVNELRGLEVLYSAMEDFSLSLIVGRGPDARTLNIPLPPFTLVGATTDPGKLSAPLCDRFGIILSLRYYSPDDLLLIVKRTSRALNFPITIDAAYQIAVRGRGTPRIANRLFRRVRDYATYEGKSIIDLEATNHAMLSLNIDDLGLDQTDRKILECLIYRYEGKPVGLAALASAIGEGVENISDVYEPYLVQIGLVNRTPKGRVPTRKAYAHLGIPLPASENGRNLT